MKITSFLQWINSTSEYKIGKELVEFASSLDTADLLFEFGTSSVRMCDRESYGHTAWECVTKAISQVLAERMKK